MGILDKMKFWDSEGELDLDSELPPIEDDDAHPDAGKYNPDEGKYENDEFSTDRQGLGYGDQQSKRDYPQPGGGQQQGGFHQQNLQQGTTGDIQKDLDLISSKLDAIKSELDAMDQRIRKIEKIAEGEKEGSTGSTRGRDPWANYE